MERYLEIAIKWGGKALFEVITVGKLDLTPNIIINLIRYLEV